MGFTKLDEGILKSSIMAETPATFKVWIALLASCDYDGVARVSPIFLSAACHLNQSTTDKAIDILSSPDQYSRSDADEGRRIRNVDGGYFVINYQKYRAFTYSGSPDAVRKREYRKRVKDGDSPGHVGTCPGHSASASVSSSLNKNLKEEIITRWNDFAQKWSLRPIQDIEPGSTRESHLRARMKKKEFSLEALLQKIEKQPFLLGKNDKAWTITFDWILCPSNYTKIMEEQYPARTSRDEVVRDRRVGAAKRPTSPEEKEAQEKAKAEFQAEGKK